jgi:hypothetical protein
MTSLGDAPDPADLDALACPFCTTVVEPPAGTRTEPLLPFLRHVDAHFAAGTATTAAIVDTLARRHRGEQTPACVCPIGDCVMDGCPVCASHMTWLECPTVDGNGI